MSRQRTKIGERVELRAPDGTVIACCIPATMGPYAGRADFHVVGKDEKVVRVTRYRLAPLVELPAWEPAKDVEQEWKAGLSIKRMGHSAKGVGAAYRRLNNNIDGPGVWGSWVELNGSEWRHDDHATADEARAACEARLRELGYRVAKAKKGVAS